MEHLTPAAPDQQRRIGRPPSCGGCGECRKCKWAAYMRNWYSKLTPEQRHAATARRDPDAVTRANRNRVRPPEHRERERVRHQTRRAVANGTIVRENCERCANPFTHAHHEDYSKPLAVNWFCPYHHSERHRERAATVGF